MQRELGCWGLLPVVSQSLFPRWCQTNRMPTPKLIILVNSVISPTSHENSGFPESNMTVKATPLSIRFEVDPDNAITNRYAPYSIDSTHTLTYCRFGGGFLINFIACPGHLDLIAEVSAALRIADGPLLIVDYTLGRFPYRNYATADPRGAGHSSSTNSTFRCSRMTWEREPSISP